MDRATFFKNFELFGGTPNAVVKMRDLVLQLAVRGRLVPQNPKDETAGKLLGKIAIEKKNYLKERDLKVNPGRPSVAKGEEPFDCPPSWEWVRLGNISNRIHYGFTASADPLQRAIRLLRITDIQDNSVDWDSVPGCEISRTDFPKYELHDTDILIARTGGTIGKTYIIENVAVKAVFASYLIRVIPSSQLFAKYLKLFLESPCYWEQLREKSAGTGQPNVNGEALADLAISLPPFDEQERIVAKVEDLMGLCDELEARQQAQREGRARLTQSAFTHVTAARGEKALRHHAGFLLQNSAIAFDDVAQLRQTVLQLAVQGRLVPQIPEDEPADALIARLAEKKADLVERGELQRDGPCIRVDGATVPFALPRLWQWARIGHIAGSTEYGTSEKSSAFGRGVPVVRMGDIQGGKVLLANLKTVPDSIIDLPRLFLKKDELLFNRTNSAELVGKTGIFKGEDNRYTFASYLIRVSLLPEFMCPDYVNLAMNAQYYRRTQIDPELTQQCGQANFNGTKLRHSLVPVPPLAEQKRIVAKVEKLMRLCDQLEFRLVQSRTLGEQLLDATIRELLAA